MHNYLFFAPQALFLTAIKSTIFVKKNSKAIVKNQKSAIPKFVIPQTLPPRLPQSHLVEQCK